MKSFLKFPVLLILLGVVITACAGAGFQPVDKEYVLTTDLRDGNLVFLGVSDEINGVENPTLNANPGARITVTLINGGMGQHDITFPEVKATTGVVRRRGNQPRSHLPCQPSTVKWNIMTASATMPSWVCGVCCW